MLLNKLSELKPNGITFTLALPKNNLIDKSTADSQRIEEGI